MKAKDDALLAMLGGRPPDGIGCAKLGRLEPPETETVPMQRITIGLDIAKSVFRGSFTRPRRFCTRPALVHGAEMADRRGRNQDAMRLSKAMFYSCCRTGTSRG
jgi:hypothetical protein